MTIAVLRANGDLIWFDAITQFTETYSGTLSAHPLEKGSVVNDHTTINNLQLSLAGIVSDADFNLDRPTITDADAKNNGINNKQFVNNSPVSDTVQVKKTTSTASSYLPNSVTQFIVPTTPVVTVPTITRPKFAAKIKDELQDIHLTAENFSLVDFHSGSITRVIRNCVMTRLEFTEVPDSGDAVIYPNMTIEVAKFVTTQSTKFKVTNKGRKAAAATTRDEKDGDNAGSGATNFAGDSEAGNAAAIFQKAD